MPVTHACPLIICIINPLRLEIPVSVYLNKHLQTPPGTARGAQRIAESHRRSRQQPPRQPSGSIGGVEKRSILRGPSNVIEVTVRCAGFGLVNRAAQEHTGVLSRRVLPKTGCGLSQEGVGGRVARSILPKLSLTTSSRRCPHGWERVALFEWPPCFAFQNINFFKRCSFFFAGATVDVGSAAVFGRSSS